MAKIVPGILTLDEQDYVARLKRAEHVADLVQVDVIDGVFAPNKTIDFNIIKKYPSVAMLEVQLMVHNPSKHIAELAGIDFVSRIIFPFETNEDVGENIYRIKQANKQAGISINPETPVSSIVDFADDINVLCIFSASPGFSGKKLEEAVYGRIKESKKLKPDLAVEIDIGVNFETAPLLAKTGADFLVATSALHNAPDYRNAFEKLSKLAGDSLHK